jgi:DNA-binding NarL/FixJ family response regulator
LETSSVRVLVVDDYEPFRRFVCSTLERRPELQVIGESSDGLEAVQKAEELQPDLIVLDIGLPTLNGIEAARRIRKLVPKSKILFLSQESSADVVQEALSLGTLGYVLKAHAGSELVAAMEAIRQGRQFISSGLSGYNCADASDAHAPNRQRYKEALPSIAPGQGEIGRKHEVQFYSDEAAFVVGFTSFIEATLKAENAVIVVATESHRVSFLQRLQSGGVDIAAAVEQKHYFPLDVADTLSTLMAHGLTDPVRFAKVAVEIIVEAVKEEHHHVALC